MEKFVNEVVEKLSGKLSTAELTTVRQVLFDVSCNYDIKRKCTSLAAKTGDLPKEVKEYLVIKKIEGLSDTSLRQYMNALRRFFDRTLKPVTEITTNDVRLYLFELTQRSSDMAVENQRRYVSAFFKWCALNDYIPKDPNGTYTTYQGGKERKATANRYRTRKLAKCLPNDERKNHR